MVYIFTMGHRELDLTGGQQWKEWCVGRQNRVRMRMEAESDQDRICGWASGLTFQAGISGHLG